MVTVGTKPSRRYQLFTMPHSVILTASSSRNLIGLNIFWIFSRGPFALRRGWLQLGVCKTNSEYTEHNDSEKPDHLRPETMHRDLLAARFFHSNDLSLGLAPHTGGAHSYFILMPSRALSSLNTTAIASMIRMPGFALQ